MNSLDPSQTFEAARRQHLIDATIEALADVGFKAASLSQIARRADVSTGLFAHYFGDKDGLLEATLRFMAARLVRATRARLRAAGSARERLYAVPDSALADQEFERRTSAVWLAFWGQITHSIRYQRIQRIYQRRMLSNLRHDLRPLVPAPCVETYATMIASMIDGVWIRSHASTIPANGAQARGIVRALIDGLIAGAPGGSAAMAMTDPMAPAIRVPTPPPAPRATNLASPVTGEALGSFIAAREKEIADAVARARQGFSAWHRMSGPERERALRRGADLLRTDGDALARLDTLCTGRPVAQTCDIHLPRAVSALERFARFASRPTSERIERGAGLFGATRQEPVGIVAGFGHWSSPLVGVCELVAPALALGNAMIFQPSALAPLSALRLSHILEQAGVPAGLFIVMHGDGETRRLLQKDPELRIIGAAGAALPGYAEGPPDAPMPKSATIVFDGADMEQAALAVLQGPRWMATPDLSETRIFVQKSGLAAFRAHLIVKARKIRCGDPLDPETQIGPLLSQTHLRHVQSQIAEATDSGAELVMGGGMVVDGSGAVFLEPTLLDACTIDMPLVRHNQFAPILTLLAFDDDDEVVKLIAARDSEAPVVLFDADLRHAHRIARQLRTRLCAINEYGSAFQDAAGLFESRQDLERARIYCRTSRIFCRDDDLTL